MPSIARPTKGATCSCDDADPAGCGPRRVGCPSPRRQLSPIPFSGLELSRRRTGRRLAASVRARERPARRVALGVLVRLRGPGRRAVLAGGRPVALHAALGARVPGHDRHLRVVARAAVLAGRAGASPPAHGAAVDRVSGRLDGGRMGVGHQGDIRFPWLGLGTSLADASVLVQWADVAGARGVTLWLAWCNVVIVDAAIDVRRTAYVVRRLAIVVATVLIAAGYGVWRMKTLPV